MEWVLNGIVSVLFDTEYMLQLLTAETLCVLGFRRRKGCGWLVGLSVVVCLAFYYGIMRSIEVFDPFAFNKTLSRALWGWRWFLALVLTACCLKLCFRESWWSILFVTSAAQATQHLAHRVRHLLMTLFGVELNAVNYIVWGLCVFAAVYGLLYFGFFRELNKKEIPNLNNKKLIFTVSACVILCLFIGVHSNAQEPFDAALFDIAMILLCFFVLCYQFGFLGESRREAELKDMQRLLQETQHQYSIKSENIELINIKCHDIRKQVRDMAGKIELDPESAKEIASVVRIYDSTIDTKNSTLNTILTDKSLYCESKGIELNCIIDGEKLSFLNPTDLYALFGNLLDNAIEAVRQVTEPGKAIIGLKVTAVGENLIIHCENYYSGPLSYEDGLPRTRKTDTRYHGFGLKSIRFVAEKYGGNMTVLPQDGIFNVNIAIPLPKSN